MKAVVNLKGSGKYVISFYKTAFNLETLCCVANLNHITYVCVLVQSAQLCCIMPLWREILQKLGGYDVFYFRFSYYTAGTGGAGPTILSTSFLLLGEEVVAYNKGSIFFIVSPFDLVYSQYSSISFIL